MSILMDLLPLIGGGVFGAAVKLFSMSMQNKADTHKQLIGALQAQQGAYTSVNTHAAENKGFAWTRRIIALSITFVVVVLAFWGGDRTVNVMQELTTGGSYLFGLIDTRQTTQEWIQLNGAVVLPAIVPSFKVIIGAYFGASIAGSR